MGYHIPVGALKILFPLVPPFVANLGEMRSATSRLSYKFQHHWGGMSSDCDWQSQMLLSNLATTAVLTISNPPTYRNQIWKWLKFSPSHGQGRSQAGIDLGLMNDWFNTGQLLVVSVGSKDGSPPQEVLLMPPLVSSDRSVSSGTDLQYLPGEPKSDCLWLFKKIFVLSFIYTITHLNSLS